MTRAGILARNRALKIFASELCTAEGELHLTRRQLAELMGADLFRAADGFRIRFVTREGTRLAERQIRLSQGAARALLDYMEHRGFCMGMHVPFWISRKGEGLREDSVRRLLRS